MAVVPCGTSCGFLRDDQSEIFNPACRNCNLLQAIKFKCDLDQTEVVDLSDQSGTVKNLHKRLEEYASDFFEERETLILLKVEKHEEDGLKFSPMLSDMKNNFEFLAKLNPEKPKSSKHRRGSMQVEPKSAKSRKDSLPIGGTPGGKTGRRQSRRMSKADFAGLPVFKK